MFWKLTLNFNVKWWGDSEDSKLILAEPKHETPICSLSQSHSISWFVERMSPASVSSLERKSESSPARSFSEARADDKSANGCNALEKLQKSSSLTILEISHILEA